MARKNRGHIGVCRFDEQVAASSSSTKTFTNDSGSTLLVYAINADVWIDAAGAGAIPSYDTPSATEASNTSDARAMHRLSFKGSTHGPWQSGNSGVRMTNIAGRADRPFYLKEPFVIEPKEQIDVTLFNDGADAKKGEVTFLCQKVDG
jgi:hypothetical protein